MKETIVASKPQSELWFATLNINGFIKNGWNARKEVCGKVIKKMKADIYGFQEFGLHCIHDFKHAGFDPEWILSEAMGDNYNAIAYNPERFEMNNFGTIPLSPKGIMQKAWGGGIRCMQYAELYDKKQNSKILFVNFHLDHESSPARNHGVNIILQFLCDMGNIPTLITADANMSVDSNFWKWYEPDMRRPYDLLIQSGFRDCWRLGNPNTARRPKMYHNFEGENYVTHDQFGTWDTDINLVSNHFRVLKSELVTDCQSTSNGKLIYPSDHYFMKSLVTLK
jgi:endonuclease/exonuclease/phosphatase family metal-dependent hydrolase